jgi:hypothetical protein
VLSSQNPAIPALDLNIESAWRDFAGSGNIPYLGVAAHRDWIAANPKAVQRLFAAYRDAADWFNANSDEGRRADFGKRQRQRARQLRKADPPECAARNEQGSAGNGNEFSPGAGEVLYRHGVALGPAGDSSGLEGQPWQCLAGGRGGGTGRIVVLKRPAEIARDIRMSGDQTGGASNARASIIDKHGPVVANSHVN